MKQQTRLESEITLRSLVEFLRRNLWLFIVFFLCTSIFTVWKFRQNPSYTASTTIILENSQSNAVQAVAERLSGSQTYGYVDQSAVIEKYLLLIGSRNFAESAARILIKDGKAKEFVELLGEQVHDLNDPVEIGGLFLGALDAGRSGNEIIRVAMTHERPENAVALVNIIAQTLIEAIAERNASDILMAKKFLQAEIDAVEKRLREIDEGIQSEQLNSKEREYKFGSIIGRSSTEAANLDREIIELQRDLMETETIIAASKAQEGMVSNGAIDKFGGAAALEALEQKAKLQRLRIAANQRVLTQVMNNARKAPGNQGLVEGLIKKREVEYAMYSELKKEAMSLDIQRISAQNKARILERAIPGSARAARNLISTVMKRGLVAVVVAGLLALFLENYDPVVRSTTELAGLRLIYLGSIPVFGKRRRSLWLHNLIGLIPWLNRRSKHLMHDIQIEPDSLQDIVFKNLRVRVNGLLNQGVLKPRVVSVMSCTSGEGKTSIASNMAKYLAMSGRRVLLVDSDLRMRSLSNSLGFANEKGVSEYLMAPKAQHDKPLVRKISDMLEFLPAGQYSVTSSELLAGETFHELLEAMKHYYDFIIVDTPPALPYSEVVPIAAASDLVMFTVLSRSTTVRSVEQTVEKLRFGVSTQIGLVLNQHDDKMFLMYSRYYLDARGDSKLRAA